MLSSSPWRPLAAGLLLSGLLCGCGGDSNASTVTEPGAVLTLRVSSQSAESGLEALCRLEPAKVVNIKSRISSVAEHVHAEPGREVKRGELLLELDSRSLRREQFSATIKQKSLEIRMADLELELSAMKAALKLETLTLANDRALILAEFDEAEGDHRRLKKLNAQGTIAEVELRRAALKLADKLRAKQRLAERKTELDNKQVEIPRKEKEQARLALELEENRLRREELSEQLEYAKITAPMDATVLERLVEPGQVIGSGVAAFSGGDTLFKLADLGSLRLACSVAEQELLKVAIGQAAEVHLAEGDVPLEGRVSHIAPQGEGMEGAARVKFFISLDRRPDDERQRRRLTPGLHANVRLLAGAWDSGWKLPLSAIYQEGNASFVFKRSGDVFERQRIRVGGVSSGYALVLDGIKEGDEIALDYQKVKQGGVDLAAH